MGILNKADNKKSHVLIIIVLLLFTFLSRTYRLDIPHAWSFDEVYHAISAEAYALNDPRGYEYWNDSPKDLAWEWLHPPLGKVFMALSIKTFATPYIPESKEAPLEASTTFAWRFPGVIFAVLTVLVLIKFGEKLFKNFWVGALAGGLYALDGLSFVQSRTGMNDIYVTFFVVLAFYRLYLFLTAYPQRSSRNLFWAGVATGLAAATKWSGFYAVAIVFIWGVLFLLKRGDWKRAVKSIFLLGVIPPVIYILSYGQWWWQGHTVKQFYELHQQIWWYQTGLKATHDYQSTALTWPFLVRPVWYYVDYQDKLVNGVNQFHIGNIYAMGHPLIWWAGLGGVGYATVLLFTTIFNSFGGKFTNDNANNSSLSDRAERESRRVHIGKPSTLLRQNYLPFAIVLVGYFGMFAPWALSPRIMFLYHYLPSVPFLCLALAFALSKLYHYAVAGKVAVLVYLVIVVFLFLYFYPHWSGLPLPEKWVNTYYWLRTWK